MSDVNFRGSRKHFLDWTNELDFAHELATTINLPDVIVEREDCWAPSGWTSFRELRLSQATDAYFASEIRSDLISWWLVHRRGANTPNWDLLATCRIRGVKGLVLVEGKAHVRELEWPGKKLKKYMHVDNHDRIGACINEAKKYLNTKRSGVKISRDDRYQLANRVAFSWKLASEGVPVVLMYLGFLGDTYFTDYLKDDAHWKNEMQNYMKNVLPMNFIDTPITCGKADMTMIIRSIRTKRSV